MNNYQFYDTCSILQRVDTLFSCNENFVISSITLDELEHLKSFSHDFDVKFSAYKVLHLLDEHDGEYQVHIFTENMLEPIKAKNLTITNDMKILATAIDFLNIEPDTIFVTNDLALKIIARLFFDNEKIAQVSEETDDYSGYIDVSLSEEEMAEFYQYPNQNYFDTYINEYIIIRDKQNGIIDRRVWTGDNYREIGFNNLDSKQFGRIKPIDTYQQLLADSLAHNKITLVKGPAGSGKSLISLGYLFNQIEKHNLDRILVFCNTVAAKNAARLGFLPGDRNDKLLDSQIGNMLASKLGSRMELERLINEEVITLLPMSDIRGYDTTGMRAGVYISEAQNLDISLMKLALQRIGEDSKCIIDGDVAAQVDDISFAGRNNGMKRVSQVFRGHSIYGEIELKEIHRSEIGRIAEGL